jgi:putative endonuclease
MFIVYLIYSSQYQKSYVGYTSDIEKRLYEHNNSELKSYTKSFRPWVLIYAEEYPTKSEAIKREKYFKTGVGRDKIKSLIENYNFN